jgi:Ni2+-binding GTPase involved in maturation of urease and hydrogenase
MPPLASIADYIILGSKVKSDIFDGQMLLISKQDIVTTAHNGKRVIKYDATDLEPGGYVFAISHDEGISIGKFAVK